MDMDVNCDSDGVQVFHDLREAEFAAARAELLTDLDHVVERDTPGCWLVRPGRMMTAISSSLYGSLDGNE